jgi:hypothetical protein
MYDGCKWPKHILMGQILFTAPYKNKARLLYNTIHNVFQKNMFENIKKCYRFEKNRNINLFIAQAYFCSAADC